jgi:hypothetical protein
MNKIPSIQSLHEEKYIKENSKEQIFGIVLNKCTEKIIYTNRHTDKTFIIFEIPKLLIGYPSYDMKSCILFMINKLSSKGYLVEFIEPFYLYVDWSCGKSNKNNVIHEKLKLKENSIKKQLPNTDIEFVLQDAYRKPSKLKLKK